MKASVPITYLLDTYETARGGTEGQFLQLVTGIDRTRYVPSVVLLRSSQWVETHSMGCHVTVLGIWKLARLATLTKLIRLGWSLRRAGCRIVHCYFNDVSLVAPIILGLYGFRIIVSRRDMGIWYTPFKLLLLRLNARFVDCYVVNSEAVKKIVQQYEWVPAKRIRVIYNGLPCEPSEEANAVNLRQQHGLEGTWPLIGVVANIRKVKRIDTLIRAFAEVVVRYQDATLIVVGDTEHEQALEEFEYLKILIQELGIENKVRFTGAVDNTRSYINMFTVAVLCSESEGLSNSIIEYMQAGRPVVCTNVGGNPELVVEGVSGYLVEVGDHAALADRMMVLLSDETVARAMGEKGRESIMNICATSRMLEAQMACYDEVLSS